MRNLVNRSLDKRIHRSTLISLANRRPRSLARWNRLGGVLDEFWCDGPNRGVATQIYLLCLLQERLSGDATLKAPRPAVSKPINMVGEVLTAAIYSNPKPNGHVGRRLTTVTDSMKPRRVGSGWVCMEGSLDGYVTLPQQDWDQSGQGIGTKTPDRCSTRC